MTLFMTHNLHWDQTTSLLFINMSRRDASWHNFLAHKENYLMTSIYSTDATKKLALRYLLENIDYRKRCLYLQEIISLGKTNDLWRQALVAFLSTPVDIFTLKGFSRN
jgi:hypothetical protein